MKPECKILAIALLLVSVSAFAAENVDIENEINRIKKELSQVRLERQRTAEEISRDKKDFADFQSHSEARKSTLSAETDSIKHQTVLLERRRDSLSVLINSTQLKRRQYELLQESFRQRLIAACNGLIALARKMPPGVSDQSVGALTFLLNDCKSKTIDNIEGLHRLIQVTQNMEEAGAAIQVGQETSTVPEIRGSASMLRIGDVFEAIVDEDGKVCAFWRGADSTGRALWEVVKDQTIASTVLKAINVREGKSLPAFIDLPYGPSVHKEAGK
jgi:Protein of unknown function (DUF3450).